MMGVISALREVQTVQKHGGFCLIKFNQPMFMCTLTLLQLELGVCRLKEVGKMSSQVIRTMAMQYREKCIAAWDGSIKLLTNPNSQISAKSGLIAVGCATAEAVDPRGIPTPHCEFNDRRGGPIPYTKPGLAS